jgi:transposase-like protein
MQKDLDAEQDRTATPVVGDAPGSQACPACGSALVVPVVYGMASPDVLEAYAAGRVTLGGVREPPGSPHWRCRDCDRTWDDDTSRGRAGA